MARSRKIDEEDVEHLADLLDSMVAAVVDHPDEVCITASRGSHAVSLEIRVDPNDIGFVVGRECATLDAIHRIMNAAARAVGVRVKLKREVVGG